MALFSVKVRHEFCVDADSEEQALEIHAREQSIAISDGRYGVIDAPVAVAVHRESDLSEGALDEVPLNAFDFTARERFRRD
ncbi:hypothetical protein [Marinobacter sp. ELB17]|uniref:hypothetical protein n=1 Tax=Marinobacter sp. ELB17 TaxID=270374 RepID=UPI0000F381FF|nr:hypothetical protein [Marinobacter sp. ELB17]EAZ98177.1 hypothetical protein MELB17_09843 [Marinobacter sp. ELB17]